MMMMMMKSSQSDRSSGGSATHFSEEIKVPELEALSGMCQMSAM